MLIQASFVGHAVPNFPTLLSASNRKPSSMPIYGMGNQGSHIVLRDPAEQTVLRHYPPWHPHIIVFFDSFFSNSVSKVIEAFSEQMRYTDGLRGRSVPEHWSALVQTNGFCRTF